MRAYCIQSMLFPELLSKILRIMDQNNLFEYIRIEKFSDQLEVFIYKFIKKHTDNIEKEIKMFIDKAAESYPVEKYKQKNSMFKSSRESLNLLMNEYSLLSNQVMANNQKEKESAFDESNELMKFHLDTIFGNNAYGELRGLNTSIITGCKNT